MKSAGWVACIAVCVSVVFPLNASALLTQFASTRDVRRVVAQGQNLWMATSGGLIKIVPNEPPVIFASPSMLKDINLTSIHIAGDTLFWLGSADGYITAYNPRTERAVSYNSLAYAEWNIGSMEPYREYLLLGSRKGLSIFSTQTRTVLANAKKFGAFVETSVLAIATRGDTIAVLVPDGIAWLAASDLKRVNFNDPGVWNTIDAPGMRGLGFDANGVFEALATRRWRQDTTAFELDDTLEAGSVLYVNGVRNISPGVYINTAYEHRGYIYAGTEGHTVYRRSSAGPWERLGFDGPVDSDIRQVTFDHDGTMWYMTHDALNGLGRYADGTWSVITQESDSARGFGVLSFGLERSFNRVMTASNGDLWVGTMGYGVKWHNAQSGVWRNFTDPASLAYFQTVVPGATIHTSPVVRFDAAVAAWWTFVVALCEDPEGNIWIGNERAYTDSVLHIFDPANERWRSLTRAESGFPGTWLRSLAAGRDRAGGTVVYVALAEDETVGNFGFSTIRYNGSPFTASFTFRNAIPPLVVNDITIVSDTLTWVASSVGLHRIRNHDLATLRKIETVRPGTPLYSVALSPRGNPVFALNGDLCEYFDSTRYGDSIANLTKSGLLGTDVYDIYYHASTGVYWISTGKGLFRFASGEYSDPAITSYSSAVVFPNPLSRSRRDTYVMFDRLVPESSVSVYDVTGLLVWRSGPGDTQGSSGQLIRWDGRSTGGALVLPGTYYYRIYAKGVKKSAGKLLVIP